MIRCVLVWSALAAGVAATATAADWPQWRGPNRDGKSAEQGLLRVWPDGGPKLVWSVQSVEKIGTGYGAVAVVGDKLFLIGSDSAKQTGQEFCTCLSTTDGSTIWKTPLETTEGKYSDGWGGGPRSTPTVDGDFVYVLGATGDLVCLAKGDGKIVWKKNLIKDFNGGMPSWGYSESVLIDGDKLLCTPGSKGGVLAVDKKSGDKVWQCTDVTDAAGYSSLIPTDVDGVRQYVTQTMKSGIGVRASDGKLLWNVGEIKRSTAVIPTPIVKDNHVFFTSGYGAGCELYKLEKDGDGTKATKVYSKNTAIANQHGGVIEVGGNVYGHSDSKQWFCFDMMKGGDPIWTSSKFGKGSLTFADGRFIGYSEGKGEVVLFEATTDDWKESGRFTIPKTSEIRPKSGRVWPHPVVANGKLYLRDYEYLYCYYIAAPGS